MIPGDGRFAEQAVARQFRDIRRFGSQGTDRDSTAHEDSARGYGWHHRPATNMTIQNHGWFKKRDWFWRAVQIRQVGLPNSGNATRYCKRYVVVTVLQSALVAATAFDGDHTNHHKTPICWDGTQSCREGYIASVTLWRTIMPKKSLIIAGILLFATSAFAQSGTTPGASNSAPGQQMHDAKKSTAPGASEYAPGHKMQDAKKSTAPGASEYAPGHQTTTGSSGGMKK